MDKLNSDDLREPNREGTQLTKINELVTAANTTATDLTTAGGRLDDLEAAATTAEADIDAVEGRLDDLEAVSAARLRSVGPVAAKDADIVHALYDDTTAAFPGPFTNPDVPRNLRVTMSASWDGGNVTVVGTDQFDDAVSEIFTAGDDVVRVGAKIFKTVTGATKSIAAGVGGSGASIGTGDVVGLPQRLANEVGVAFVAGVSEDITLDDTYDSFAPATTPSATTYLVLVNELVL